MRLQRLSTQALNPSQDMVASFSRKRSQLRASLRDREANPGSDGSRVYRFRACDVSPKQGIAKRRAILRVILLIYRRKIEQFVSGDPMATAVKTTLRPKRKPASAPVPQFHSFDIRYRSVGNALHETVGVNRPLTSQRRAPKKDIRHSNIPSRQPGCRRNAWRNEKVAEPKIVPMQVPRPEARAIEILRPECVDVYNAQIQRIWWLLIPMRESMHILNSIVKFPLNKFVDHVEIASFWNVPATNCGNSVVLGLHSLLNDGERDTLSLRKLAKSVRGWIKSDFLDWYKGRLQDAKFDSDLQDIAERVRLMRHAIAHIFLNDDGMPREIRQDVSESEIEGLYSATKRLFRTACLTEEYVIDIHELVLGDPGPRPIDKLLNLVAKHSYWINRPEKHKERWRVRRERMTEVELQEFNTWRARLDLPPA